MTEEAISCTNSYSELKFLQVDQYLEKVIFKVATIAKIYLLFFPDILVVISMPKII